MDRILNNEEDIKASDIILAPIISRIGHADFGGMTSTKILKVLSMAAKNLDRDGVYLEIGSYRGLTIIGAMLGNTDKYFNAVDDFSQYGVSTEKLMENIAIFFPLGMPPNFQFYQKSIEEFFQDYSGEKSGVAFIDALHTYKATMDYFWLIRPFLAEEAIVIFDDAGKAHKDLPSWVGEVWEATEELLKLFKGLKEVVYYDPILSAGWHLGLRMLSWKHQ